MMSEEVLHAVLSELSEADKELAVNNSKRANVAIQISMIQKGICPCCKDKLTISQRWCISLKRKTSKGGEYKFENIDIVHVGCYESWQSEKFRDNIVKPVTNIKSDLVRARAG